MPPIPISGAFTSRGGKLLVYHGWADQQVVPQSTINYYGSVLETMGGAAKTSEWFRVFMAPGMAHCRGGDGPNTFDALTALETWVEKGQGARPDRCVPQHGREIDRTRPLCALPDVAVQGNRQHRRRRELRVPHAVTVPPM